MSHKARLQGRMNELSPISQLPTEILTGIFCLTCHFSQDSITPLFFGGICKDWREIAWSTPLLWNTISIKVSRRTHVTKITLLREWLLRAQSSPLSIKLTTDEEYETTFYAFRGIIELLVTRAEYWQTFDCRLPTQCHDILQNHKFPLLITASLRPPVGTILTFSEPPGMFLSAPRLVSVDLSGYNFSAMVLPWEQLRHFKTQFLTVAESLKVLRRSPALKECHLECVYSPGISDYLASQTLYSELELLDLSLIKNAAIKLLDNLTLPNLRVLRVRNSSSGCGNLLYDAVSSLNQRSSCHLEGLSLEHIDGVKDDVIIACLESIPSLNYLHLSFQCHNPGPSSGLSETFISRLRPSQQGSYLLPNLTSLKYRGTVGCDSRLLVDMLSERWRHVSHVEGGHSEPRLTRVQFIATGDFKYEIPYDVQADIDLLVSEGMQLRIR